MLENGASLTLEPPGSISPDAAFIGWDHERPDDLAAGQGILIGIVLSVPLWAALMLIII